MWLQFKFAISFKIRGVPFFYIIDTAHTRRMLENHSETQSAISFRSPRLYLDSLAKYTRDIGHGVFPF